MDGPLSALFLVLLYTRCSIACLGLIVLALVALIILTIQKRETPTRAKLRWVLCFILIAGLLFVAPYIRLLLPR
jgi:phosphoglycerol transferase MdoB-like AlkP superfamily enzyme